VESNDGTRGDGILPNVLDRLCPLVQPLIIRPRAPERVGRNDRIAILKEDESLGPVPFVDQGDLDVSREGVLLDLVEDPLQRTLRPVLSLDDLPL